MMRTARYGRMKLGKCLTTDYFVGCSADVLSHVDSRLVLKISHNSGRRLCVLTQGKKYTDMTCNFFSALDSNTSSKNTMIKSSLVSERSAKQNKTSYIIGEDTDGSC